MKSLRNCIEHFQFEFTAKDVRLCVGRLVRGLSEFTDIFLLFDLEEEIGTQKYHVFEVLADEYEHELKEASIDVREDISESDDETFGKNSERISTRYIRCHS